MALKVNFALATLLAGASAVALNWATPASACVTRGPPPALVGGPVDGETDVPTDVVPFYDALRMGIGLAIQSSELPAAQFVLVSPSGDEIRTTVARSHVWTLQFTPEKQLEPHTTYTLRGTWTGQTFDATLVFTTGAGPLAASPPAPVARLQHYQFVDTPLTSCSPPKTGSCISFAVGLPVEATPIESARDAGFGFGPQAYLFHDPFFFDLAGVMQGTPADCMRLRTRAPNGKMSDPTMLCRGDGPLLALRSDKIACTPQGITQDGELIDPLHGCSCTLRAGSHGGRAEGGSLVAALLFVLSRRRDGRCRA